MTRHDFSKIASGALAWLALPAWFLMSFVFALPKAGIRQAIGLMNPQTQAALLTFDFLDANRWLLGYVPIAFMIIGGLLRAFDVKTPVRITLFLILATPFAMASMQLAYLGGKILE